MINDGAINNNATISELTDLENYVNTTKSNLQTSINGKLSATQSKGSNGWFKFSNGIIIQWGRAYANNQTTVTLPTPYSNANYAVACATENKEDGGRVSINTYTNTTFKGIAHEEGATSNSYFRWIAIGY